MNPLLNAPPRLSDLHGDDRTAALLERKLRHDANWRRSREQRREFPSSLAVTLIGGALLVLIVVVF